MTVSFDPKNNKRLTLPNSLTQEQISILHGASLEIMAETGMRFFNEEALELFRKGGAKVTDGNLVSIPSNLVEWALQTAPKNITIYDQTGKRVMNLGGDRSYFGPGSDCMYIYDLISGKRRTAMLQDVINGVRLVDALPNLKFVMSMFLPSDVPEESYERHQMVIMLRESTKPIVFVGIEAKSTVYAVQMAEIVAGGAKQLQNYPFIINYVNTVSAFQHNDDSLQRLLYAAERNLPTIYAPGNTRGLTAPMTVAGSLALGNAGQLAGLVLSQLKREGSPFIRSDPSGGLMDMQTMVSLYGAPEGSSFGWDLVHYYGTPTFGIGGCSDAKIFDSQAAAEATLSLFDNMLNGVNLVHDVGYLDCAMTGSLELVHLSNEILGWLRKYFGKLEIDHDTLPLDLIHEVGPDGHFLETDHTLRHVREDWKPDLFDRLDYDRWNEKGATTFQQRSNKKVQEIIETHRSRELSKEVIDRLEIIANG